jgi:tRNA threonylcarbamoyladenosine biosynthesis protein TsaB
MIVAALDTASPSTVAGVMLGDGNIVEARDDPPAGSRGEHAARALVLLEQALTEADASWDDVDRLAVGVGPGGFTGLRIGIATARALAQGHDVPLVPVSSLAALAGGSDGTVAAVLDARRGEVFAAVYESGRELVAAAALAPERLAERIAGVAAPVQAVGDGAIRFRAELERAGAVVPADRSSVHRIGAAALCRLGAVGEPADRDRLLPDYLREPDAKPNR